MTAYRVDRQGNAIGSPIVVTASNQYELGSPVVAHNPGNAFFVAWVAGGGGVPGSPDTFLRGRCFNADGSPRTAVFQIASLGGRYATTFRLRGDGAGFVVAWKPKDADFGAQRYDAGCKTSGVALTLPTAEPKFGWGDVTTDHTGRFIAVWTAGSCTPDPLGYDVCRGDLFLQRFTRAGVPMGTAVRVNTSDVGMINPDFVRVVADAAGNSVVAWASSARRFAADGSPLDAAEFNPVSLPTGVDNRALSMDDDGDWVFSWADCPPDAVQPPCTIYAQRYAAGNQSPPTARGTAFVVNPVELLEPGKPLEVLRRDPVVVSTGAGNFTVVWSERVISPTQISGAYPDSVWWRSFRHDVHNNHFSVTTANARYDATPVADGPAGTYSFNARFCMTDPATLSGVTSRTVVLTNGNSLLNRSRDGGVAGQPGGTGSSLDLPRSGGYADGVLGYQDCVTVPYRIGLSNRNQFSFSVDLQGDDGKYPDSLPSVFDPGAPIALPAASVLP